MCVDQFTRWPEAIPIVPLHQSRQKSWHMQAFFSGWISRSGVFSTVVTNCCRQFESNLWHALMTPLGSKHAGTTPYHSQANGKVERFHHLLKAAIGSQTQPLFLDRQPPTSTPRHPYSTLRGHNLNMQQQNWCMYGMVLCPP